MSCRDPAKAVLLLDLLSEFFDNGRQWLQGDWHDNNGRRCLIDALRHLRARNAIVGDGTGFYLREAQPQWIYKPLTRFNDACGVVRGHPGAHRPGAHPCGG